jgi:hypothetical protein
MPDLASRDELLDRAGHVLDRHLRVDAVLVQQVDRVDAEPAQAPGDRPLDVLGSAGQAGLAALLVEGEPELRRDDDLVADGREGLADELLVDEGAGAPRSFSTRGAHGARSVGAGPAGWASALEAAAPAKAPAPAAVAQVATVVPAVAGSAPCRQRYPPGGWSEPGARISAARTAASQA